MVACVSTGQFTSVIGISPSVGVMWHERSRLVLTDVIPETGTPNSHNQTMFCIHSNQSSLRLVSRGEYTVWDF